MGQTGAVGTLALGGHGTGFAVAVGDDEAVAGFGQGAEAQDFRRGAGGCFADILALVVNQSADPAGGVAGHDVIAHRQRAVNHQHGGTGAALAVQLGLDDHARGPLAGVGPQFGNFGHHLQVFQQIVDALAGAGGYVDRYNIAAPVLYQQLVFAELPLDPLRVGAGQVHLVDRHHDRNIGGFGVVDRLNGLRHNAVIGGHHQHRDVGDAGAAGADGGKSGVAGGVQESDGAAAGLDLVGAHVLGDAADFAVGDAGIFDVVQQRGLAVVNMAHHHHHRGARRQIGVVAGGDGGGLHRGDDRLGGHSGADA